MAPVKFDFNRATDTIAGIAAELLREFSLPDDVLSDLNEAIALHVNDSGIFPCSFTVFLYCLYSLGCFVVLGANVRNSKNPFLILPKSNDTDGSASSDEATDDDDDDDDDDEADGAASSSSSSASDARDSRRRSGSHRSSAPVDEPSAVVKKSSNRTRSSSSGTVKRQ
jgi:hypothetical protein